MASKTDDNNTNSKTGFGVDLADASVSDNKKTSKSAPKLSAKSSKANKKQKKTKNKKKRENAPSAIIPKVVSNRMIRRVGIFSGIPTLLAFLTIPASYLITEQGWIDFPSSVVLFASITFLILGLVGVSYGIISASWDEELNGSALGISEFRLNLGRIQERRRIQKDERKRLKEQKAKAETEEAKAAKKSAQAETTSAKAETSEEESADS